MRIKSVLLAIMAIALVVTPQAQALEMEAGGGGSKFHSHGYGELHYNAPEGGDAKLDLHRMVWGFSYDISETISLHTEVDFEHAAQEMELEFAYLDFLMNPAFNVRTGVMLMPVGPLNEFHEPPLFYSVERPGIMKNIIPTTWQEGGFGIFGTPMEGLSYRLYVVGGLGAEGFSAGSGIRGGRSKVDGDHGHQIAGEKLAVVARLEYAPIAGLDLGLSLYEGGVDQTNEIAGDPSVGIFELDARVRMAGVDFQAVYAKVDIDDADKINNTTFIDKKGNVSKSPLTGNNSVGEELVGWYVELAYHLATVMGTDWDLVPFVRISEFNTQDSVPTGFLANPENDKDVTTYGLAFYPHPQVAIKADLQTTGNAAAGSKDSDQFNLGVTWMY